MILKQTLLFIASILTLGACVTKHKPEIRSICYRDDIGNYIVKWETDPNIHGVIKLFVSNSPDEFDLSRPVGYANNADGIMKYITRDNITRKYFLLSFNDKYYHKVGARAINMDQIQNMRDIGGYKTTDAQKSTDWGKVYRSGKLYPLSNKDSIRLNSLGIRTIINLCNEDDKIPEQSFCSCQTYTFPINIRNKEVIIEKLLSGRIRKGDGLLYMQDTYLDFISEHNNQFAEALKLFLDEDNYPILINSEMGKDRVGFLTAMLLSALNIPEETIKKDYLETNEYIDISQVADYAHGLNSDAQETVTLLLSANEALIDLIYAQIKKQYGSVDAYLTDGLQLTAKERDTLKDILLREPLYQ